MRWEETSCIRDVPKAGFADQIDGTIAQGREGRANHTAMEAIFVIGDITHVENGISMVQCWRK